MTEELNAILAADLPSQGDATKLADLLYARCYTRSILDGEVERGADVDLTPALEAANRSRAHWIEGWRIAQVLDDGRIVARRGSAERIFLPGDYISHRGIGSGLKEGSAITVYSAAGSSELQEMFYYAFSEALSDHEMQSCVRIYWNVRPEGAARLMESLTGALNRFQVPFRFKCLNKASRYPRRDAAVLYFDRRYYRILALVVEQVHAQVLPWLNAPTPLFARRLAHGLAMAEDPGDSFGQHRCAILAGAMAASCGRAVADRLAEVERHFAARGLSLEVPWRNAGSSFDYEYPISA